MARTQLIAVAAAGALAIAACSPAPSPEPIDATPVGNTTNIDYGALTDAPPHDLPAAPARKPWTYRHLSKVAECNIGVLNYDGQEIILTSAASSYPVACGAAALP